MSIDELAKWVVSTDRRLLVMNAFRGSTLVNASKIAGNTGRSVQNMSRALNELEERGLVESMMIGKRSWKKYILTETGKKVLTELEKGNLLQV
jgi:DNA-binding MarR family transcriptional regulator